MNKLWRGLGSRALALTTLALLIALYAAAFVLPQIPVPASESVAFSRWLAELQPRLGEQTRLLAGFGLLTLRASWLMRLCLVLLALVVAANLDGVRRAFATASQPRQRTSRLLVVIGGILIIAGWGAQMLWGWREPEVVAWPGDAITVADRNVQVAQPPVPVALWTGRYGLHAIARRRTTGLEIQVSEESGPLALLPSVNEPPQDVLRLAFTPGDPEAFFAVPEAGLIFRLNQLDDAVQIQAYRSASGQLLMEDQLPSATSNLIVDVDGVTASVLQTLLPSYEVTYNPGALPEFVGMVCLAIGGLMRERIDRVETGTAPDESDASPTSE